MAQSLLEVAGSLRRALSAFDPQVLSAADCARATEELAATAKACAAASLLAAACASQMGAHRDRGFHEAASWVARETGSTRRQAKDALETARSVERFPRTKEALLAGDVSLSQAREITKAEDQGPEAEAELLEAARAGDLSQLRDRARELRFRAVSPDALHKRQLAARRFRSWRDGLGMVCFEGALPPETGVPFVNRLERIAQRLRRESKHRRSLSPEPFERTAADAFAALLRDSRSDAGSGSWATDLTIVCDLRAWRRGHAHPTEPCHIIGGGPLPVELAKELTADAFVRAVLHDGVEIRTVRHFGRHLKAELKTALDLGPAPSFTGRACVDCGSRYGLEYDHLDPVANWGATSYDNLAPRCWSDHRAKTERDRKAGLLGKREAGPDPP